MGDTAVVVFLILRCPPAVLLALIMLLWPGCTGLFFHPLDRHLQTPDRLGLTWRDVWFTASDGVRLHGWFLPAAAGAATGTIVFLHGNAENISTHIAAVAWMPAAGLNVFLVDYRGYGRSEGTPTMDGLHRDTAAALAMVGTLDGVDPARVVLFGQSLGGSIAITALAQAPQQQQVRALIVEGAFSGYRQITRDVLSRAWLTWPLQWPLALTVDDSYRPVESIAAIAPTPVLIIHGADDSIVPPAHARALYAAARQPKALWLVPQAGHIAALRSVALQRALVRYLQDCAFTDTPAATECSAAPAG